MTTRTAISVSPFKCRWIVPGTEHHEGCWSFAICVRLHNVERLVNEEDCSRCPRWEEQVEPEACTPQ
jgi:hypothetical protein